MLNSSHWERRRARAATVKANASQIIEALVAGEPRISIAKRFGVYASDIIPVERKARKQIAASKPKAATVRQPSPKQRKEAAKARRVEERRRQRMEARQTKRKRLAIAIVEDVRSTSDTYNAIALRHGVHVGLVGNLARAAGIHRGPKRLPDADFLAAVDELNRAEIEIKAGIIALALGVSLGCAVQRLRRLGVTFGQRPCKTCGDVACASELCGALTPADADRVHVWTAFVDSHRQPARHVGPSPIAQQLKRGDGE